MHECCLGDDCVHKHSRGSTASDHRATGLQHRGPAAGSERDRVDALLEETPAALLHGHHQGQHQVHD